MGKRSSNFQSSSQRENPEGINYCINQEEALKVFLTDGEVPLDNNVTEGALRSFCLHKHAWKLIDSIDGAKSSAIIYSITETAKANNLKSVPLSGPCTDSSERPSG